MTRVLPRGNWMDDSGEAVPPGFPEALPHPAAPDPDDVAALRAAAAPLIDLMTARGLLAGSIPPRGSAR